MKLTTSFLTLTLADATRPAQETKPDREPYERLEALQAKAQEVLMLGGWKSGAPFPRRVAKILKRISYEANNLRSFSMRGCDDPDHWDWQSYLESQTNDRYNRDDPCLATEQIFLGFKRWFEIYTRDCRKPTGEHQFRFLNRKSPQVDKLRNKMFFDMQCDKYIKKYNLGKIYNIGKLFFDSG